MTPESTRASGMPGLVSVVIPCFGQAHFLADAIDSVLRQTYPNVEVIVINDGSPDETAAVASRYGVGYLEQENKGLAAARNAGLERCQGEFVVFLDADDRLLPDALRINSARLAADPALAFVAGASRYIARDGAPLLTNPQQIPSANLYAELLRRNRIRMPGMVMFRRRVFDHIGAFDTTVDACADYDVYLRVSRLFPVAFHGELIAEYRRHEANMSLDPALMLRQLSAVMRKQRQYVSHSAELAAVLRQGLANMQQYYGDQLADRIRARVRARKELHCAIADAGRLLVLYPRGLVVHAFRKSVSWTNRADGDRAPVEDAPVPQSGETAADTADTVRPRTESCMHAGSDPHRSARETPAAAAAGVDRKSRSRSAGCAEL
jgi:glycosyltransferase involved in cell wall biosynthesis